MLLELDYFSLVKHSLIWKHTVTYKEPNTLPFPQYNDMLSLSNTQISFTKQRKKTIERKQYELQQQQQQQLIKLKISMADGQVLLFINVIRPFVGLVIWSKSSHYIVQDVLSGFSFYGIPLVETGLWLLVNTIFDPFRRNDFQSQDLTCSHPRFQ